MTIDTTAPDRARVMGLLWGFFPAQVLQTLARLDVPDLLPLPLDELATRTGTRPDELARLLRAARGLGLVETERSAGGASIDTERSAGGASIDTERSAGGASVDAGGDVWSLTPDGTLLRSGVPGSAGNLARLFCGGDVWRAWGELEHSVRTGQPALERITGKGAFEAMADDPAALAIFTEAMAEGARMAAPGIVATCDLAGAVSLVDVGGGNGTLLAAFLDAHPGLHGILFDTPHGVGEPVTGEGAEVVTGDFFASVPAADAHVVKSVIHDWDDERSVAILSRIRGAMPPHGRLFLVEPVLAEDTAGLAAQPVTLMSDLNMMVCTGGRERTLAEFTALLGAAGLALVDVRRTPPPTNFSVMTARPVVE